MKITNNYPRINGKLSKFVRFRNIILLLFLISIIVCVIVNLSVGGKKWMLYVIGGEILVYFAFFNKPLVDNSLIKKITIFILIVCGYLYLIDFIENTNFSYFVITIIIFSIMIVQLMMYVLAYKKLKKKLIPMFFTAIGSIIFCLLAILDVFEMNWPTIVIGSLGLFLVAVFHTIFRKTFIIEVKKYFSAK